MADRSEQDLSEEEEIPDSEEEDEHPQEILEKSPTIPPQRESVDFFEGLSPTSRSYAQDNLKRISLAQAYENVFQILATRKDGFIEQIQILQKHLFDTILEEVGEEDEKPAYRNMVLEVPLKGSKFLKNRGYITPDRGYITREMREKVSEIRSEYHARNPKNYRTNFKAEDFVGIRKPTE